MPVNTHIRFVRYGYCERNTDGTGPRVEDDGGIRVYSESIGKRILRDRRVKVVLSTMHHGKKRRA